MRRVLALVLAGFAACAWAVTEEVVTIPTRGSATLSYLLVQDKPGTAKVVAISFVGGYGAIDLARRSEKGPPKFGPTANFLVRIRDQLVDAEVADVIVDSPSDKLPQGMGDDFRLGPDHLADVQALVADLRKRLPAARIFLIGTSRGAISAAALGAKLGDSVQGVVLSSTVTNRGKAGEGLSQFDYSTIKVPLLLVHHRDDGCALSPYGNVEQLSKSYPLISVSGGNAPQTGPCDPLAPHGYFGREAPVVQAIRNWMLGREFARDIQ